MFAELEEQESDKKCVNNSWILNHKVQLSFPSTLIRLSYDLMNCWRFLFQFFSTYSLHSRLLYGLSWTWDNWHRRCGRSRLRELVRQLTGSEKLRIRDGLSCWENIDFMNVKRLATMLHSVGIEEHFHLNSRWVWLRFPPLIACFALGSRSRLLAGIQQFFVFLLAVFCSVLLQIEC